MFWAIVFSELFVCTQYFCNKCKKINFTVYCKATNFLNKEMVINIDAMTLLTCLFLCVHGSIHNETNSVLMLAK
jgi:hypothetical protein